MAKPEFSETQFVFGYLSELYHRQLTQPHWYPAWEYFMFPSALIERELPVDFLADYYTHSEYYQFKRSEHLTQRRGSREIEEGVPASYLSYYRFKIYNRTTSRMLGQFEKLLELAQSFPNDRVRYCAPCFNTEFEFHNHFRNRSIISNSIIIDCAQFNDPRFQPPNFDINDGHKHFMVYKIGTQTGYLCSEPKEIKIYNAYSTLELTSKKANKNAFFETINSLYEKLYLTEDVKKQRSGDISERFYFVGRYLLQYYNIIWRPMFHVNT